MLLATDHFIAPALVIRCEDVRDRGNTIGIGHE